METLLVAIFIVLLIAATTIPFWVLYAAIKEIKFTLDKKDEDI